MPRSLLARFIVGGVLLFGSGGVAGVARADTPRKSEPVAMTGKADEPKKHLGEIELYLKVAIDNCKVLYQTTQLQPGSLDAAIEKEQLQNIDGALATALAHVNHMKSLPEAKVSDMARVDEMGRTFARARTLVTQLKVAVRSDAKTQLQSLSSQLYAQLKTADQCFGMLADQSNVTRVDKIDVPERQPVSGGSLDDDTIGRGPVDRGPPMKGPLIDQTNGNSRDKLEPTPSAGDNLSAPARDQRRTNDAHEFDGRDSNGRDSNGHDINDSKLPSQPGVVPPDPSGTTGRQY